MAINIGIIGGGQLGLMIAQEAHRLGAVVSALDPASDAPAFAECDSHIIGRYDDIEALKELGKSCDVVTYEFENVPAQVLEKVAPYCNIKQGFRQLLDSQDRLREKNNASANGLPVPAYIAIPECTAVETPDASILDQASRLTAVQRVAELEAALDKIGYPAVLKTRTLGYDGHGQAVIKTSEDIGKAAELLDVPCILEAFVDFDYECSVVMVRDGETTIHFPVGRNVHKRGILDLCIVPAENLYDSDLSETPLCREITSACEAFMEKCNYEGILAIELFVKGNSFLFNEMAPRPHNSGHYTIEGCTTNQYRELCKYLLGMPLEVPMLKFPTLMKNILGKDLEAAENLVVRTNPRPDGRLDDLGKHSWCGEASAGVFVHLYGKSVPKPERKMGHITFAPMTLEEYNGKWAEEFVYGKQNI